MVVFPVPLPPMSATRRPGPNWRVTPLNRIRVPIDRVRPDALNTTARVPAGSGPAFPDGLCLVLGWVPPENGGRRGHSGAEAYEQQKVARDNPSGIEGID